MTETETRRWIRADGEAKATGQARYTADLAFPGLAHARLLLAGRAHARIVRLDTTRARALPGVLAVLTQDDVPDRRYGVVRLRRSTARCSPGTSSASRARSSPRSPR